VTELDVAVIGGGFSGCAVTAQLARRAPSGMSLALFEPGTLGHGAAYGTRHAEHLLNTRVNMMSIFPDDPGHFQRWLGADSAPDTFESRSRYGVYVNATAAHALERPGFTHVRERVTSIVRRQDGAFTIVTEPGQRYVARSVALATGNPLPDDSFLPQAVRLHPGYVPDPWRFDYRQIGGHVLLIGSGLTALDVLVALDNGGHRGAVDVVSRHGRYPEVHASIAPYDVVPALDTRSAHALLRSFRRHVEDARKRGFDWRAVVDAVRQEAEAIWRRLPAGERRRFERHLRGHWERRRHRAPEAVAAVRRRYEERGRLHTYAGTLASMEGTTAVLALRDGTFARLTPDWIVNCTGLSGASGHRKNGALAALFDADLLSVAPGGLGLRADGDLAAIDGQGNRVPGLWITGPPARGSRFEATAVPELRVMAEQAAVGIIGALEKRSREAGNEQAPLGSGRYN
jgi:uncharacterized NAD(P)/FAD-binding protein YdhS